MQEITLHNNPLTHEGIRTLVKAVMARSERHDTVKLALHRASFCKAEAPAPIKLDEVNPDGHYSFNLSHPGERQIAIDLIRCLFPAPDPLGGSAGILQRRNESRISMGNV